ncbi:Protein RRP5 [Entophlyctis sp. JEL0112]|nr:Protein RRP5 [Entophlyctis sp. JEL0112]
MCSTRGPAGGLPRGGGRGVRDVDGPAADARNASALFADAPASSATALKRRANSVIPSSASRNSNSKKARRDPDIALAPKNSPPAATRTSVASLTFKSLTPGVETLCVVKEIHELALSVSLPNQISGTVSIAEISSQLTAQVEAAAAGADDSSNADDIEVPSLQSLFRVGQALPCVVVDKPEENHTAKRRKLELSLRPDRINANLDPSEIVQGLSFSASVSSVEDNGYILAIGIDGHHAFLHNKHATALARFISGEDKPESDGKHPKSQSAPSVLAVGQVIFCSVLSIDLTKKLVVVTADPSAIATAIVPSSHNLSFESLKPGMFVATRVKSATNNRGIVVSVMNIFEGSIELAHIEKGNNIAEELETVYPTKKKVQARILYVDSIKKKVGLTLLPHIIDWKVHEVVADLRKIEVGTIFENVAIRRIDRDLGLFVEFEFNEVPTLGYVHLSRLSDRPDAKISPKKYAVGSLHPARVVGHDFLDNVVQFSMKPSVVEAPFISHKDVKPGLLVKATIKKIEDFGLLVDITENINAIIPNSHLGEYEIKKPSKIFKIGMSVKCRVLTADPAARKIVLTLKKPLVNSPLAIISTYSQEALNQSVDAHIIAIKPFGLIIGLYGPVRAIVPKKELSSQSVMNPEAIFNVGQVVRCKIISVDAAAERMTASIRQFELAPDNAANVAGGTSSTGAPCTHVRVGQIYDAPRVLALVPDGAIVELSDGVRALLPKNHFTDHLSHVDALFSALEAGSVIKTSGVVVLSVDVEKKKVVVSAKPALVQQGKRASPDAPVLEEPATLKIGSVALGYVRNITDTLCFVGFVGGFVGICNLKSISDEFVRESAIVKLLTPGQTVLAKIQSAAKNTTDFFISLKKSDILTVLNKSPAKVPTSSFDQIYLASYFSELDQIDRNVAIKNSVPADWITSFPVGKVVEATVLKRTSTGYSVDVDDVEDASLILEVGRTLEVGSEVAARVIHVDFAKKALKLVLWEEGNDTEAANQQVRNRIRNNTDYCKKASASIPTKDPLEAIVQLQTKDYVIVSLPSFGHRIAYVPVSGFYTSKIPEKATGHKIHVVVLEDPGLPQKKGSKRPKADLSLATRTFATVVADPATVETNKGKAKSEKPKSSKAMETNSQPAAKSAAMSKASEGTKKITIANIETGMHLPGTIDGFDANGVFIKLENSKLSGLCHRKELSDKPVPNMEALYSVGDKVMTVVLSVDRTKKKVSFGLKASYFKNDAMDLDEVEIADSREIETQTLKAKKDKKLSELQPLDLGGSGWDDESEQQAEVEELESDSEDEAQTNNESKRSKRAKKREKREEEERIAEQESHLLETKAPDSADSFERLLMGSPNSSFLWIKFMAFHLQMAEIGKAREVAERALKIISFRESQELMNVWVALLNLESAYGSRETMLKVFERAVASNEPKAMHLHLANLYEGRENFEALDQLFAVMTKRFKESCKVWVANGLSLLKRGKVTESRAVLQRSLKSLAKRKHVKVVGKFAQMEFKHGEPERGRTLFEGIITNHPKRLDMWSVYLDMEVRYGDADHARRLFERSLALKLSSKKMKFLFKKYLEFEKTKGTPEGVQHVKEAAMESRLAVLTRQRWTRFHSVSSNEQRHPVEAPVSKPSANDGPFDVWADEKLRALLESFNAPIRFAAGYGSGVFKQIGYDQMGNRTKAPMVDLIFGVSHPEHWHSLNIKQNPQHYSFLARLGAKPVSLVQERFGARMYFNPDVSIQGVVRLLFKRLAMDADLKQKRVKYGVISMNDLMNDLDEWINFYVAGRMQKPIKILRGDSRIKLANDANLANALRTALLTLPAQFTQAELFAAIVGLSYLGDFRMTFGENPRKIQNIVNAQSDELRALYAPVLRNLAANVALVNESDRRFEQSLDAKLRGDLLLNLPKNIKDKVIALWRNESRENAQEADNTRTSIALSVEVCQKVAASPNIKMFVEKAISDTVRWPAITQSLKGLATAGPTKSFSYIGEKLSKRF